MQPSVTMAGQTKPPDTPHPAPSQIASNDAAKTTSSSSTTRAVRGASLLILLQVASRAVTFIANQALLRFLTAQLLGVSAQLEVYYLSVLFFARESLRVAIQRQDTSSLGKGTGKSAQAAVNLGYVSLALGVPLAGALGWLYLHSISAGTQAATPRLALALWVYACAAVVELASEPAFVVMQAQLQFRTRAAAEAVATFLRCAVTLGATAAAGPQLGVLPFALGQLSYGVGLLGVYAWRGAGLARAEGFSLLPRRILSKGGDDFALGAYLYRPTLQLASSMMAQSVVKHLLTQGDTFLVSALSTPTAQGVYALANNYGGLAARLVFQPVEESSRSYFSRLLAAPSASVASPAGVDRNKAAATAATDLQALLKAYALLSVVVTTVGPTAAPLLLSLVAGPRWADSGAGACLAAYMWYIPLLAANGVAEAFVASVASEAEVHRQSAWMGAFSLGFAGAGFVLLRVLDMGAVGLVVANAINMLCRIAWCAVFISRYFRRAGAPLDLLGGVMPKPIAVAAAVVTSQLVKRVITSSADSPLPGARQAIGDLVRVALVALPFVAVL
ncbi:oligosaccharide translocation protein RFT1, variant [Lasiosphaeria miniovina]|uniref:Man(5)GlcNAc(2)-PP-dolichol translocation protein RFT1 n=1 Tax=Lasiosphaeria miniovina TaxID=1954250 RepID=A0AA40ECC0_9PEZI|nr:oligosaccharide translocation protein RFT1, variant [Lasiosphaeria miniovina]KAK0733072.1 oligosaccharide translocation protein RFT1, variant [Lasiosphaeria miniovina]